MKASKELILDQSTLALVGFGYWGEKIYQTLIKNFPEVKTVIVETSKKKLPRLASYANFSDILSDKNISHVVIATPEETHFALVKECLENKKNVFVEKPLCLKKTEAKNLQIIANENNLRLFVDYIFLFDPHVLTIKEYLKNHSDTLGNLEHIQSIRHSINISKPNITVYDDLAIHDIYLGSYFFEEKIYKTASLPEKILSKQCNQASVVYQFKSGTLSANYSWIQPTPKRVMTFFCSNQTIVWDKNEKDIIIFEKEKIIDKISIRQEINPLKSSLESFLSSNNCVEKSYEEDVEIIEKLDSRLEFNNLC